MTTLTARMSLRLLLPALLLCGLAALGDPLPDTAIQRIEPLAAALLRNTDQLLDGSESTNSTAARDSLSGGDVIQTASAMRLLITLPAFNRSCLTACDS